MSVRRSFDPGLRLRCNLDHVDRPGSCCKSFTEVDGSGPICLAQFGDERGLHGDDLGEEGVDERFALVGEVDKQSPSVGRMCLTSDQVPSLERVKQAGHGAGRDHEAFSDDRGGQRFAGSLDYGEGLGSRVGQTVPPLDCRHHADQQGAGGDDRSDHGVGRGTGARELGLERLPGRPIRHARVQYVTSSARSREEMSGCRSARGAIPSPLGISNWRSSYLEDSSALSSASHVCPSMRDA